MAKTNENEQDDVLYTRMLYHYFNEPEHGDVDSIREALVLDVVNDVIMRLSVLRSAIQQ